MIPTNTRILIVDDISAMRNLTVSLLRSLELENVHSTMNGHEALKLISQRPFDIVVSDWNMPVMNGLELLKAIRCHPKLYKIPFLMITAEADRNRITEAIGAGVSGMLVKPYKSAQLEQRIAMAMRAPTPSLRTAPPPPPPPPTAAELAAAKAAAAAPAAPTAAAPAAAAAAPAAPAAPAPELAANRPTVLIVDDAPDNLQLLSALFKDEYRIRVANNGSRALEICCSDNPPDLVLLDVMMPDIDGFEVARRMREHPAAETIPVIFVTALTGNDARMKGLALGAIDFVTKPIDPDVLKPRVKNLLRYIGLHKQLQSNFDTMVELARLRDNVDHMIRHDLKGPLAGIIGLAQTLAVSAEKQAPELVEQIRMIESSSNQVIELVTISSELFKIESGNFSLNAQNVDMVATLEQVTRPLAASFAGKNVTLSTSVESAGTSPTAVGDPILCFSIFNNLIKNAFEAAPAGSNIAVALRDDTPIRVTITNQGAVPKEIRERFFEKYVTHGKPGGTGIGTYSAKRLTEAMNGSIGMTTTDEENVTVLMVTLPKATIQP